MTTIFESDETCAACGTTTKITAIGSTNTMGAPDLDTRPAEMARSTMPLWLHECPACGHIARDLSRAHAVVAEVVRTDAYRAQRRDPAYPELANQFLCATLILEKTWAAKGAFWNAMAAAWACDDAGNADAARRCRLKAIELWHASTEPVSDQPGGPALVLADLLRRTGQFDRLPPTPADAEPLVATLLDFERTLAARRDDRAHRVDEA
jgi:hypothetical protein